MRPVAGELVHLAEELARFLVGQRRVRLVEEEDAGVAGDRARDLGALLGGERAVAEELVGEMADAERIHDARHRRRRGCGQPVRVPSRPASTFSRHGEVGEELRLLMDDRDGVPVADRRPGPAVEGELARVRRVSSPAMMRTSVLLPAPFGPAMPSTSPGRMSRSMPSSAMVLP